MVLSSIVRKALVFSGIAINLARVAIIPFDSIEADMNTALVEIHAETSKAQIEEIPEVITAPRPVDATLEQCEAIGASLDSAKLEQIEQYLRVIPTGMAALSILNDYEVAVKFTAGAGSSYKRGCGFMVLDSDLDSLDAALVLVHEANHAKYTLEMRSADPFSQSRSDYVSRMIEEEAESEVLAIEAKIELEAAGIGMSKVTSLFETRFHSAYNEAVQLELTEIDPIVGDLGNIGREAGKANVIEGFSDGFVLASTTGKTYSEVYGDHWDTETQLFETE